MAYQRLSTEEKEQRKKELMQKVENIVDNFQRSPADLIEYLKFNSKFYQYSKNNNTLIYQQNRYAQYCGSFKHFKDMGYSVKKGEHGIKILVPYISKYFYNADTEEWKKIYEASVEQKQKIKNGEMEIKQYTSFGVGTVFDISQTDCPVENYPKFFGFGHESKSHRELFNAVKYYAEGKGIPVEIVDFKSITLSGQYNAIDNSIELSDKLNDDRLLSVMTHELSHALLHNSALLENNNKHIMQIEFEADALSLLLRERLGISDIEDARQAHLQASFKQYMEWVEANKSEQHCPTLSEILDNINETYSNMVEDFDNSISHYFELHPDAEKSANNFSKSIDDFINRKINPYAQIFVCKTTQAMLACGAKNLDVIINQSTLRKIMSDDVNKYKHPHNLDEKIIKAIPEELNNPIMILNGSEPSSIVLISNLTDENNQNIIISCRLNSEKSIYEVNEITSVYPKNNITNYINNQLSNKKLIGCNKKRANRLLKSLGLQSSEVEASIDYTDIIPNSDKNVNNQISENSANNHFNDSIHEINNRLSSEVIAHLQMFVDSDLQIYGEIQESTLNAINMQGYKYVNGNFEKVTEHEEYENHTIQDNINTPNKQTVIVNCFAGPGAGKTTCAWEIASELKKRGIEAEYVGEYAKELVWDGNSELLDGSLQSQQHLYNVQHHRVQRLISKVDVVVTDSPAILGAMYLKEPNSEFEHSIISDFNKQHNFNLFINRGNTFQQAGRIHNLDESKAIDNNIKSFLEKYNIYYGTYEHSTIDKVVNNIEVHLKKINHKLPLSNSKAKNDNLTFNDDSQMYSESDSDELNNLFKISVKLNEQNLQPIDVLQDKKLIDFYSFSCNINNSETVKELLWKIQQNDMQTVAITPTENGYILNCIGKDFTIYPFNNIVYETNEKALSEVFKNNQIAKLVEPSVPKSCSAYKDLSILSESDNLKYPFIQVLWSDTEQLKNSDCISLNAAQEKFDLANQAAENNQQNTSFSLHLSDSEIYNFKYNHSLQGQEILEYIKSHLQEVQSDQTLNKSLTTLNSYINSQTSSQNQFNQQSIQTLDSFDTTEYPI